MCETGNSGLRLLTPNFHPALTVHAALAAAADMYVVVVFLFQTILYGRGCNQYKIWFLV